MLSARTSAFQVNVDKEYERNGERYAFLRWGAGAFDNFRVVPPGTGICHQVNLEYLAQTVWTKKANGGNPVAFPDTLVGTDSHTTMVNGLSVLGWGVGGIEAEAAMLGQPISMLIPEVVGFRLTGELKDGVTATDLVLTVTEMLRRAGVVGKFVEFFGAGLANLPLEDRATIANMAPEYGATCGFFPVDEETLAYLEGDRRARSGASRWSRPTPRRKALYRDSRHAGPGVHQAARARSRRGRAVARRAETAAGPRAADQGGGRLRRGARQGIRQGARGTASACRCKGKNFDLGHGDVVIAAITSCTNTSNPYVMVAAGLLAKNAVKRGLSVKPWVKTSLAPGSQVVTDYLDKAGLQKDLDTARLQSGRLWLHHLHRQFRAAAGGDLADHPRATDWRSPRCCRAIAISKAASITTCAPTISPRRRWWWPMRWPAPSCVDLATEPLGIGADGEPVYLKDIWPSAKADRQDGAQGGEEVEMFKERYGDVFRGDPEWRKIAVEGGLTYGWDARSTYVQNPPYFAGMSLTPSPVTDVEGARILGLFLDSITTDHISPAGAIKRDSPAGRYLIEHGVAPHDFNSYGSRRGNHEVMMRGTFANTRIKNQMVPGVEGGVTLHYPSGEKLAIYDAAMRYHAEGVPLVVFAGKEYGTGSSRDWAAKGTRLLGVRAVIAESFERIHRSNLIGMGVLPLVFAEGMSWKALGLKGDERVSLKGLADIKPMQWIEADVVYAGGETRAVPLRAAIDTFDELDYFRNGGILHYVLRSLARDAA